MKTTLQTRARALAQFEASFAAMVAAGERLRSTILAEAGMGAAHPRLVPIMEIVAKHYGLPVSALASDLRTEDHTLPRHIAMLLCLRMTTLGTSRIGRAFNRDHTCVLHAKKAIERRILTDHALSATISNLQQWATQALQAA